MPTAIPTNALDLAIEGDEARRLHFERRMELLEEVSQCVAGSLNVHALLEEVSTAIVPRFADWITVDLMMESDASSSKEAYLDRVFIHHGNHHLQLAAESYRKDFGRDISQALLDILRTGDPIFIPDPTERRREAFGLSKERWERLQELGICSLIMVPLRSRRRTLGILGFHYGHSMRQYSGEDVEFAVEISSRIAAGIDNASLFEEAEQDIKRRTELQKSLEDAKEQAEVANRTKDQFIANLSHELRTPLTPVLATIEILAEDPDFPEAMRPSLDLIRRNVEIEARLIDDLLDMTRVAKGKLRFVEADVDFHILIPEVIEMCQQDFDRGKLQLVTRLRATNPFVRGDRDRLSQVFWNVLHNATKFTPESGIITIRTSNDEAGIRIDVEDTGCGIEASELKQIFDPFEQRAASNGAYGGLGLGLAIAKSIVEMHGGTIQAQSVGAGHGSTFTIRLAATQTATRSSEHLPDVPAKTARPLQRIRSGRILMVDDHLDTNAAIKILLERRGYNVTTASSVAHGLELARLYPFDILVSDIGLPDGDGIDLLRAIRTDERTSSHMHAIAVSGYGTESDVERSLQAGFKYHLRKPVAFPDLERAIAEALSEA